MSMLGRAPTQDAIDYVVRDLSITSPSQVQDLYRSMLKSPSGDKYRTEVVQRAFQSALGRAADSADLAKWSKRIADSGQGLNEIQPQVAQQEPKAAAAVAPVPAKP